MSHSDLVSAAQKARTRAYANHSHYTVGAAILGADGRIYSGCNVENISYGLTVCAERNAVGAMVAGGCLEIIEVVVATRDAGTPCGACRQVLIEFCPEPNKVTVTCVGEVGEKRMTLAELLPSQFSTNL